MDEILKRCHSKIKRVLIRVSNPTARKAQRTGNPLKKRVKMPKLKTKSGAKKRFKFTATGKVKAGVAGKRHRLISHNSKYIRQNRGTSVMADADAKKIKSYMPYA